MVGFIHPQTKRKRLAALAGDGKKMDYMVHMKELSNFAIQKDGKRHAEGRQKAGCIGLHT